MTTGLLIALALFALAGAGLVTVSYQAGATTERGTSLSGGATESGSAVKDLNQAFAAGATDEAIADFSFTTAGLQLIVLLADSDCTIETNSGSSPANTISLKAGRPLCWHKSDGYFACPFTANVTAGYLTSTAAVRLRAKILSA